MISDSEQEKEDEELDCAAGWWCALTLLIE
jgi:hypothetical protein